MLRKVIVIGLDGLEPTIVDALVAAGELPHLARLIGGGPVRRMATTYPAQTPVAWSSFATGTNPGGHGIFDFVHRDPATYLPTMALNTYQRKNRFLPPRAVNLRGGEPVWQVLSRSGIPSIVLRCPCTYPPDEFRGRMLSGMGVPDLLGSFGHGTFYTTRSDVAARESETVVSIAWSDGAVRTRLLGPVVPRTRERSAIDVTLRRSPTGDGWVLESPGQPRVLPLAQGQWSDWLRLKFPVGPLQSVRGMVRLLLIRTAPEVELYASPANFDPESPLFPISHPPAYAAEIAQDLGNFYTTGMVEDHTGLNNERFDEPAFLDQCCQVLAERERMLHRELARLQEGFLFCLFDTPDRLQHMFWRHGRPTAPDAANNGNPFAQAIAEHYRACDAVVGRALGFADRQTLFLVASDHGFASFERGVHLNRWLYDAGLLALAAGVQPGAETAEFLHGVDWARTKAYAVGLGSIYLNLAGREARGIVPPDEAPALRRAIADRLSGLTDRERQQTAVRRVACATELYAGPYAAQAPDLVVNFAPGYRASWGTALGGLGSDLFEDNRKRWSGDHILDPALVPGVLVANVPLRDGTARIIDLAPTILSALGVPKGQQMEGESLLP